MSSPSLHSSVELPLPELNQSIVPEHSPAHKLGLCTAQRRPGRWYLPLPAVTPTPFPSCCASSQHGLTPTTHESALLCVCVCRGVFGLSSRLCRFLFAAFLWRLAGSSLPMCIAVVTGKEVERTGTEPPFPKPTAFPVAFPAGRELLPHHHSSLTLREGTIGATPPPPPRGPYGAAPLPYKSQPLLASHLSPLSPFPLPHFLSPLPSPPVPAIFGK